ncbi:MAG: class I SAM-dependent methyltransferase [Chitinophagaceae bacterium]|nr:class I SAM-dependent methyltransferase [Chitinophagaceae bacterium]
MNTKKAYNSWSSQYDTNINRTRDLEAVALQQTLAGIHFDSCLEIGCGTGKNTAWLLTKATEITAVDLSDEMLARAKEKIHSDKVSFLQADILQEWDFVNKKYDLVSFSLVLEHIENLEPVFYKVSKVIAEKGFVYIGELHPFKQYTGSKARFTTTEGEQVVTCFNHHISDFVEAAKKYDLDINGISEYFDDNDRSGIPRILTILFRKNN